ncbi:VOC family protein [Fructilactobacillus sp. Tb1]|uniref:VOC family protein n=1 Tax=Fructilactobacillus sp. Tb1 TaxID=3422304 RepID=UPI003D2C8807
MKINDYFTGVQHVGIPTKDLDNTIKYYEALGFKKIGDFQNGDVRCAFMQYGNLTIETWEGEPTNPVDGAINHIALNTTDIESAFKAAHEMGLNVDDDEIQYIGAYWDKGIKFFNVYGPNHERIEFCQILK